MRKMHVTGIRDGVTYGHPHQVCKMGNCADPEEEQAYYNIEPTEVEEGHIYAVYAHKYIDNTNEVRDLGPAVK